MGLGAYIFIGTAAAGPVGAVASTIIYGGNRIIGGLIGRLFKWQVYQWCEKF